MGLGIQQWQRVCAGCRSSNKQKNLPKPKVGDQCRQYNKTILQNNKEKEIWPHTHRKAHPLHSWALNPVKLKLVTRACEPADFSFIPETHKVEGENQHQPSCALTSMLAPRTAHTYMYTQAHKKIKVAKNKTCVHIHTYSTWMFTIAPKW